MAHPWRPVVDFRAAASRTPVPEEITILGGVALLAEAPADPSDPATPMVVTVGGAARSRVTGVPAAGQFRVRVSNTPAGPEWLPELEFHASDEGLAGTCDYYRTGTIVTALRWEAFQAFLEPLYGIADEATLNALYPPTADRTQPGRAGRLAFTVDGAGFVSDGSVWTQLAGMAKWSAQALAASILGATSDALWTEPGAALVGEVLEQAILDVAQDGAFAIPGILSELATLGITSDAVIADYGALTAAVALAVGQDGTWAAGPAYTDTFTGTDGTALTAHTPDSGGAWSNWTPGSFPQSNRTATLNGSGQLYMYQSNLGGSFFLTKEDTMPSADYDVSIVIDRLTDDDSAGSNTGQWGATGRVSTTANTCYFALYVRDSATNQIMLIRRVNGTDTSLGTYNVTWTSPSSHSVTLRMRGTTISVLEDGVERISVTDSQIADVGRPGIYCTASANATATYWATRGAVATSFMVTAG